MGGEALAGEFRRRRLLLRRPQARDQRLRVVDMGAVRIAREIELGEARLPLAAGDRPEDGLRRLPEIARSSRRPFPLPRGASGRRRRAVRRGSGRDRLAAGSGRGPFRRGARAASRASLRPRGAGEIELLGQQRLVGGNLLSSGRGEHVVADRDHHAGDVGARRRQMAEQGGGEGAVAAAAVERDIVGLGREGDEEPGKLADAREPGRGQRRRRRRRTDCCGRRRERRGALPLPLPSSASTGSSATVRDAMSSSLRSSAPTGTR